MEGMGWRMRRAGAEAPKLGRSRRGRNRIATTGWRGPISNASPDRLTTSKIGTASSSTSSRYERSGSRRTPRPPAAWLFSTGTWPSSSESCHRRSPTISPTFWPAVLPPSRDGRSSATWDSTPASTSDRDAHPSSGFRTRGREECPSGTGHTTPPQCCAPNCGGSPGQGTTPWFCPRRTSQALGPARFRRRRLGPPSAAPPR